MDTVQEKINERKDILLKRSQLNEQLNELQHKIDNNTEWLYKNCKHDWEYYRETSLDQKDYICKACKCFKSHMPN